MRIALIAVLLTGCTAGVERQVAEVLKDPGSAKFTNMETHGSGADQVVCGEVNAKNGFGAYAGAKPFMVRGGMLYLPTTTTCCLLTQLEEREGTASLYRECEANQPEPIPLG